MGPLTDPRKHAARCSQTARPRAWDL